MVATTVERTRRRVVERAQAVVARVQVMGGRVQMELVRMQVVAVTKV